MLDIGVMMKLEAHGIKCISYYVKGINFSLFDVVLNYNDNLLWSDIFLFAPLMNIHHFFSNPLRVGQLALYDMMRDIYRFHCRECDSVVIVIFVEVGTYA